MSDYDNTREDDFDRKLEASNEARDASIEFHRDNWMTAVTQSVEKSNGSFDNVSEYVGKGFDLRRVYRPANSADVFANELNNNDFMARAAEILIRLHSQLDGYHSEPIVQLFNDMAASYAEFQYESKLGD
jgi:hypothetical protein